MEAILAGLTPEQREAVTHRFGPLLVLAGVGTGKTTVISRRVAYLIEGGLVDRPSQLLVFTFSNRAAEEMLDRAFEWVRYSALDAWVATYHSVCERILRENALLAGLPPDFKVLDEWDQRLFVLDRLTKFPLRQLRPKLLRQPLRFLHPLLNLVSRAKDEAVGPEAYQRWLSDAHDRLPSQERDLHAELLAFYEAYQEMLAQEGVVDFGDLVLRAVALLENQEGLRDSYQRRFPFVLADEFQDTSRAQLRLVELLGGHGNVTAVGDDDQAIYGFRGVPWDNLLAFLRSFPQAKVVTLTENFRSTQSVLDAAMRLIRANAHRLEALALRGELSYGITKELVSRVGSGSPPCHRHFPTVGEEAEFVADKIRELHHDGIPYSDMAILYRNRYRPDPYLRALSDVGMPWTLSGRFRAGLFDQEEIKLLQAFLRAVADPGDSQALYHLLGSPIYRMPGEDLATLTARAAREHHPLRQLLVQALDQGQLSPQGQQAGSRALADLTFCQDLARTQTTGRVLYAFLAERTGYLQALAQSSEPRAAAQLENIAAFFERVIKRFEDVAGQDRVPWFVQYVEQLQELGWDPMVGEAEPGADAVQVLTFHQAKGMEFEAVFLTGLVEDFFPGRLIRPSWALPQDLVGEALPPELLHVEEQRRLVYVGMTRAKRHLYLFSADDYRAPGEEPRKRAAKVSRFVEEALGSEAIAGRGVAAGPVARIVRSGRRPEPLPPSTQVRLPLQLSFRQVDDWLTCPLKYKYVHLLRVPIRLHPVVNLGNAVHQAIQAYNLVRAQGERVPVEQLLELFRRAWRSEGFLSKEHEQELRQHGEECVRCFHRFEEGNSGRPTHVEKFFAFTEGQAKVIGYWDRVDETPEGTTIIDYKTSDVDEERAADRRAKESLQLAIYALAHAQLVGQPPAAVQLRFLTPEVIVGRYKPTPSFLQRAREAIQEATQGILGQDFAPRPSYMACSGCAYRSICPHALPL